MILKGLSYKGDFLYSIHRHDFAMSDDRKVGIDGGQYDCLHLMGKASNLKVRAAIVPYTYAELRNKENVGNKLKFKIKDLKFLKYPLTEQNEKLYQNEKFIWGTRIVGAGGDYLEYKMLWELSTSHLQAILDTQPVSDEYRTKIKEIKYLRLSTMKMVRSPRA